MKHLFASLFAILCSLFLFSTPVLAKVMYQENGSVTIAANEIIDDDLFVVGENVDINGTVTGDVFVGAGTVRVSGHIKGGLFAGTGDLSLSSATIDNSVIVGAGNVFIDKDSKIGGSLIAGAGNLKNYGSVGRNVMAGAGMILLNGQVAKEVRVGAGNLELGPKSIINGDLIYSLGETSSQLNQDDEASVGGTVIRYTPPENIKNDMEKAKNDFGKFGVMASRGMLIVSFLGSLIIGFVLLKLFPKTMQGLASEISKSPWSTLGTGFLIVIAAIPVFLMLLLTIVGVPLAGFLFLLLCLELHLAKLVSAYAVGRFAAIQFNWSKMGIYGLYAIGLTIFYVLRAVPGIGMLTSFLFTWAGLGAIWIYVRSNLKSL